ncbi:hypothetical protein LguiA_016761 [Lonicera macranthoides]
MGEDTEIEENKHHEWVTNNDTKALEAKGKRGSEATIAKEHFIPSSSKARKFIRIVIS